MQCRILPPTLSFFVCPPCPPACPPAHQFAIHIVIPYALIPRPAKSLCNGRQNCGFLQSATRSAVCQTIWIWFQPVVWTDETKRGTILELLPSHMLGEGFAYMSVPRQSSECLKLEPFVVCAPVLEAREKTSS